MDPTEEFEKWWDSIQPMTSLEQQELLLKYISGILDTMRLEDVIELRVHVLEQRSPLEALIELLDGHILLRQITGG